MFDALQDAKDVRPRIDRHPNRPSRVKDYARAAYSLASA